MPMSLYQAMAFDQEGKFQQAIDVLQAHPLVGAAQRWATLSMCIKAGVYAHLDPATGRSLHDQLASSSRIRPRSSESVLAQLANGRLLVAEKNYQQAITALLPLSREIQLGPAPRAIAHYGLMQAYQEIGDTENMQKHRREAAKIAGNLWFATDVKTAA
jgi:tetratricopeptide (TPR) repeat protein